MVIDFPDHEPGQWGHTPWWLRVFGYQELRRINWRWTVDHNGCYCIHYWEYSKL